MSHITNTNKASIEMMTGKMYQHCTKPVRDSGTKKIESFQSILAEKSCESLKFSKHANARLESRDIELTDSQIKRLNSGAGKAKGKGIKESLVIVDNFAFIVNTKNNTVVTAVDKMDDAVFTNIDGAVIN